MNSFGHKEAQSFTGAARVCHVCNLDDAIVFKKSGNTFEEVTLSQHVYFAAAARTIREALHPFAEWPRAWTPAGPTHTWVFALSWVMDQGNACAPSWLRVQGDVPPPDDGDHV
jgi:hypothetical protein